MTLGQRRTLGGLAILALAALIAAYARAPLAFVALGGGLAVGWLLMTLLIRAKVTTARAQTSRFPTAAVAVGVATAAVIISLLSAVDLAAPTVFAPAPIAFVAGLILALRLSPLGKVNV